MNDLITYSEVRKHSLSGNKAATISVLDRVFYRKIAAAITVILVNHTNIKPNLITKVSIIFSILGGILLAQSNSIQSYMFAAVMFNIYFLLDVVDGSLARVLASRGSFPLTSSDKIGKFYDALAGYIFCSIFWSCLCINIFVRSNGDSIIFAVILALNCALLGRLIQAKYIVTVIGVNSTRLLPKPQQEQTAIYKIFKNLEFGGFFGIFLFFLWIPLFKYAFVVFYMFFNLCILAKAIKDSWFEK
jgi:phosphatidylglycerophosphate synthase